MARYSPCSSTGPWIHAASRPWRSRRSTPSSVPVSPRRTGVRITRGRARMRRVVDDPSGDGAAGRVIVEVVPGKEARLQQPVRNVLVDAVDAHAPPFIYRLLGQAAFHEGHVAGVNVAVLPAHLRLELAQPEAARLRLHADVVVDPAVGLKVVASVHGKGALFLDVEIELLPPPGLGIVEPVGAVRHAIVAEAIEVVLQQALETHSHSVTHLETGGPVARKRWLGQPHGQYGCRQDT